MIADAHCHAWPTWPYPGTGVDASTDALLRHLDTNGVERALLVGARLAGQDGDNDYVTRAARRHPDRFWCAVEVDAFWRPEYGTDGADDRLDAMGEVDAVALFPDPAAPGWLTEGPGARLVERAVASGLPLSIAAPPSLHADIRTVAQWHPRLPVMLHHLGMVGAGGTRSLLELAMHPNVLVKWSGAHYAADPGAVIASVLEAFGAERVLWGSDWPAAARHGVGYELPDAAPAVLGENLVRVLNRRGSAAAPRA